eukprot:8734027-Karenia_brevis.AAC.1
MFVFRALLCLIARSFVRVYRSVVTVYLNARIPVMGIGGCLRISIDIKRIRATNYVYMMQLRDLRFCDLSHVVD